MAKKAIEAWHNVLEALCDVENWNKLHEQSQQCIDEWPEEGIGYRYRGIAKNKLGQHEEAIKDFDKSIDLDPTNSSAFNNRGNAKHNLGQYDAAIRDFNEVIELEPNYSSAFNNRGASKIKLGQYEEAIKDFNTAIDFNPSFSSAFCNRGVARSAIGQDDEAIKDWDKAIELNPKDTRALTDRGVHHHNHQRYQEALDDVNRALEIEPENIEALRIKGLTLRMLERFGESKEAFESILKLDPNNIDAKANMSTNESYEYLTNTASNLILDYKNAAEELERQKQAQLKEHKEALSNFTPERIIQDYDEEIADSKKRLRGYDSNLDNPTNFLGKISRFITKYRAIILITIWLAIVLYLIKGYSGSDCNFTIEKNCDWLHIGLTLAVSLILSCLFFILTNTQRHLGLEELSRRSSSNLRIVLFGIWLIVSLSFYATHKNPNSFGLQPLQFADLLRYSTTILFLSSPFVLYSFAQSKRAREERVIIQSLTREKHRLLFWIHQETVPEDSRKGRLAVSMLKHMNEDSTADISLKMLQPKKGETDKKLYKAITDLTAALKNHSPLKPD